MSQIHVSKITDVESGKIWSILNDFGGVYRFHSKVESSPILNNQASGLGAERQCVFYDGKTVTEVVSGHQEGELIEVRVTKGSLPMKDIVATFRLSATADGGTQIDADVDYTPKFGPLGLIMNWMLMRPQFRKIFVDLLDGLEVHAKTGALIGKDGVRGAQTLMAPS